jgi:TPR repeat protein
MLVLATGVAVLALGFALFISWEPTQQSVSGLLPETGVTEPKSGVDAAYKAYRDGDDAASLRLARPLAEQGSARAEALMGLMYYHGRGVQTNEQEAARWFRRAADQGEASAQFHLGMMYATGRGLPQSFSESAKWIRRSANAGYAEAQFNLGVMYYKGQGVSQSNLYAHVWFNLAAARFSASEGNKRDQAIKARDDVATKMTPEEISRAQKLAREWTPTVSVGSS